MDAAVYGARAAYIGAAVGTATVLAGQMFDIPVSGTMAHSWVMYYKDEFEAFKHYAENYPDGTVLLVDTYDVIGSGIPNAIRVAKEVLEPMGKRLKGIRIDSGDLAYLSKKIRKMLDDAGSLQNPILFSVRYIRSLQWKKMVHLPRVSKSQKMWRRSQIRDLKMCTVSMMKQDTQLRI